MIELEQIKKIISENDNFVFFGGAGVSTASGIPDFRGSGGLYTQDYDDVLPEERLHISHLLSCPEDFYTYYRENMLYLDAEPNRAHYILAEQEKKGKIKAVITQNIDGLHQMAGSLRVVELHGSTHKNYCMSCGKEYPLDYILEATCVPFCEHCGGMVRPDVVLYGEALNASKLYYAENLIAEADVLIVAGSSLTVNPAASLVECFQGKHLIIINYDSTPYDDMAEFVVNDDLVKVLRYIFE
ncbi:MAG: NAD-dependent protein deacylase [Clostridia bacterium]|nr:NAD-dependent protein deacylase [Clostridia bacterium]